MTPPLVHSGLPVVIEQTERTLFYQTKRAMALSAPYQLVRSYQSLESSYSDFKLKDIYIKIFS